MPPRPTSPGSGPLCGFLVAMVVRLEVTSYRPKSTRFWADWALETSVYRLEVADPGVAPLVGQ
jgi:hypothetical protein